jgi:outer membrane immunogenic protein
MSPSSAFANTVITGVPRVEQFNASVTQEWASTLRARLGWLVTPSTLAYVTGGVALSKFDGTFMYNGNLVNTPGALDPVRTATAFGSWSDIRVGGAWGGGLETEISNGWKARLEYFHTDFGSYTRNVAVNTQCTGCSAPSNNATINLRESSDAIRAGLGVDLNNNSNEPPPLIALAVFAVAVTGIQTKTNDVISPQQNNPTPITCLNSEDSPFSRSCAEPPCPECDVQGSKSFTAGGIVGYHWQYGGFVLGFEGDLAWKKFSASNSERTQSFADFELAQRVESFSGHVGQDWDASLRARFGTFVTPTTLMYLTGGLAIGEVNGAFSYFGRADACFFSTPCTPAVSDLAHITTGADSWRDTRIGWTIGSGVETAIGGGWKVRAEYRYTDLGSFTHDVALTRTCLDPHGNGLCAPGVAPNTGPAFLPIYQQASFQTFRLGLVYSFDGFDLGGFIGGSGS